MLTPITHTHTSTHSQAHAHTCRLVQRVVKSKSKAKSLMQDLRVYKTTRPIDKKVEKLDKDSNGASERERKT